MKSVAFFAKSPKPELVESEIDDRGGVERQELAHDEAADDADAERAAKFGAGAGAESQGRVPKSAAMVVIRMGRKRNMQASKMASSVDLPPSRSACSAKSIIIMAFFFTMPMRRTIPMMEMILRSCLKSMRASIAPTLAEGRVEMMVSGWTRLS